MREALKAAIKAMENSNSISYEMMHAIADCKEALAQPDYRAVKTYHEGKPVYVSQPEQKPWMYRTWNDKDAQWLLTDDYSWPAEPLYTAPPKREWVGLTDEDVMSISFNFDVSSLSLVAKAVEAKLKELNT